MPNKIISLNIKTFLFNFKFLIIIGEQISIN